MMQAADIRKCWEQIRPGLEELKATHGADWRPEDIYALVINRKATLYTDPEHSGGFVVLSRLEQEFSGEPFILVLAAWAPGEEVRASYFPQIEDIARASGAAFIECCSPRRGFERTGWTVEHVCYRRRLT